MNKDQFLELAHNNGWDVREIGTDTYRIRVAPWLQFQIESDGSIMVGKMTFDEWWASAYAFTDTICERAKSEQGSREDVGASITNNLALLELNQRYFHMANTVDYLQEKRDAHTKRVNNPLPVVKKQAKALMKEIGQIQGVVASLAESWLEVMR